LYELARIPDFKEGYSCTVFADRVVVRHLASGREESVPSGRPGHTIPDSFRRLMQRHTEFEGKRGQATSARTSLFNDALHVQVFEGGGIVHELATGKYRVFWHRRRTAVGVDEPMPQPGEITAYVRVPGLVGNYGMIIWEDEVMLIDHAGRQSSRIGVSAKSTAIGGRVRALLEKNPDLVKRLGGALSEDRALFGDALRVQVFDGGVLIHETASGKNRAAWHQPRGWVGPPIIEVSPPTPIAKDRIMQPTGPAKTLTHSSGARVELPASAVGKASKPSLEVVAKHPPFAPLFPGSPVYAVNALCVQNSAVLITVDLPAGKAGDRGVVLVVNDGRWLRLPSTSITLANGQPGQRVRLTGVSFPWIVTVAGVPQSLPLQRGLVKATSPEGKRLRLEQLRWTDRAAFAAAVRQADADARDWGNAPSENLAFVSFTQDQPKRPPDPRILFARAQRQLLTADPDANATNKDAVTRYLTGLDLLWQARNAYNPARDGERTDYDRTVDPETKELVEVGSSWRLDQIIEQYCGRYAPWGVQLILELARKGEINPEHFDLRVLPVYGSKVATDVVLVEDEYVASRFPWSFVEAVQYQVAQDLKIPKGKAHRRIILRFWSPQVMDWQVSDLINVYKSYQGWSSWLIALGKLALFAEGGVTLGVVYDAGMPVLEKLFIDDLLGGVQQESRSWGLVAGMGYENVNQLGSWVIEGDEIVTGAHLKDIYTNVFMAWWLEYFQFDLMNHLRESTNGASGYANHSWEEGIGRFRVPPIMLMANLWGPTTDPRSQALRVPVYPQGAHALIAWTPDYVSLARRGERGYDLHEAFTRRGSEWLTSFDLANSWSKFREEDWVFWHYDSDPVEQQVKFRLDTKRLEEAAAARKVSVERLMEELLVEVRVGEATSSAQFFCLDSAYVKLTDCLRSTDDKDHWFALRLQGKLAPWRKATEVPEALLEAAYQGPVFKGALLRPHLHYTIVLKTKKERQPAFVLPVTFDFKRTETERRIDATEKVYVDRTTAREEIKSGGWFLLRAADAVNDKATPPLRFYWETQGARGNAILEFPFTGKELAEWKELTGLGQRVYLTAELDGGAKPPRYVIRDAQLTNAMGKVLKMALGLGNSFSEGWASVFKSLGDDAKPHPRPFIDVAMHDLTLTVTSEGPQLRVSAMIDATISLSKNSQRLKREGLMHGTPEK
jgi:hypothetical protein